MIWHFHNFVIDYNQNINLLKIFKIVIFVIIVNFVINLN